MATNTPSKADEAAARILGPLEDMLKRGDLPPWARPWRATGGAMFEHYGAGGRRYHGGNALWLEIARQVNGWESREWMTYRAIQKAGGQVRKGEKGTHVSLYKSLQVPDEDARRGGDAEATKRVPLLRSFVVFSLDQADGIEPRHAPQADPEEKRPAFQPIEAAARILEEYQASGRAPALEHGGDRAYYAPATDRVRLPEPDTFHDPAGYYATAFHEHGHGTGHASRLGRPGIVDLGPGTTFGTEPYALEELAAETCAAVLCGVAGIEGRIIENAAAYCRGWLRAIQDNRRAFVGQAGRGLEAARYILGEDDPRGNDRAEYERAEQEREAVAA